MRLSFERATLGRTGLEVGRLGISASYGVPTAAVERAFEQGVNYLYWGSMRTKPFAQALRNLSGQRDRMVLLIQSYSRMAALVAGSLERALHAIGYDHADLLLLGRWQKPVPPRILDAAREAQRRGLVRHLAVSTHKRTLVPEIARGSDYDVVHFRYNAAHPGAERDIFSNLPAGDRPGLGLRPLERVFVVELLASGLAVELPVDFDASAIGPSVPGLGLAFQNC